MSGGKRFKKAYVETGNICNLSCSFCPGTKRIKRYMSLEEFSHIAMELRPYTDYIYFHLMGEPLMHPELEKLLDIAGKLGFKVIITTNGTLLMDRGQILCDSFAVHKVNISLQSFEANRGGDMEKYVSDCARFALLAAGEGKICVLRLWNSNGLDTLNGQIADILRHFFPGEWKKSRSSLALSDRIFLEPGEKFDWPDMKADIKDVSFCMGLRDQIGVLADGTVVPCCLDHEGDIALGNLLCQSLEEILSSPKARELYEGFSQRRATEKLCHRCGYAQRFK